MNKFLVSTLAMLVVVSFGSVFAQSNTASHDVRVRIPDLLMLRIVDGTGNNTVAAPVVGFDFDTNAAGRAAYMTVVEDGAAADLEPTSSNFGDIVVLSNRASWTVDVAAADFTFTDNVATDGVDVDAYGLALSDISVAITGADTSVGASFTLGTNQDIASGSRTTGWRSLGIAASGYRITVNGDEAPGTYVATVTYTVTAP